MAFPLQNCELNYTLTLGKGEFRTVWKTNKVVVELHCRGSEVVLENQGPAPEKGKGSV